MKLIDKIAQEQGILKEDVLAAVLELCPGDFGKRYAKFEIENCIVDEDCERCWNQEVDDKIIKPEITD